jgi:hypothetical protein
MVSPKHHALVLIEQLYNHCKEHHLAMVVAVQYSDKGAKPVLIQQACLTEPDDSPQMHYFAQIHTQMRNHGKPIEETALSA